MYIILHIHISISIIHIDIIRSRSPSPPLLLQNVIGAPERRAKWHGSCPTRTPCGTPGTSTRWSSRNTFEWTYSVRAPGGSATATAATWAASTSSTCRSRTPTAASTSPRSSAWTLSSVCPAPHIFFSLILFFLLFSFHSRCAHLPRFEDMEWADLILNEHSAFL